MATLILGVRQVVSIPGKASSEEYRPVYEWIDRAAPGNAVGFDTANEKDARKLRTAAGSHAKTRGVKLSTSIQEDRGAPNEQGERPKIFVVYLQVTAREVQPQTTIQ